ncbi:MAG TPA: hypothetical protein ACQGQH_05435 [Xylella sp.]
MEVRFGIMLGFIGDRMLGHVFQVLKVPLTSMSSVGLTVRCLLLITEQT